MLGPEYLASLPEPAVKLWQQAEDDILRDIARRFKKAGAITATAAWQAWRLEQTRAVYTDAEKKLAEYTGQSREVIRRLLIEAGTEALLADDTIHRQAGKEPPPANQSGQLLNLLNAGYRQTLGTWLNLTATTANTVSGEFEHALSRAWLQVSSGAFDYNTAIRRAVDDLADRMAYVTYPSGHKDTLETAVRRAVLTGVNQTAGKLQMARAEEMGCEFVEVTAHEGARPDHALWQGRIYHIGGEIDYEGNHYEDFVKATGYGTGPGLCGWNCRHNFYPFYPGISLRAYTDERLEELNAPSVEYRGKKYTRYEISQMQRAKERTVRKYKRRFLAESEAGLDTGTSSVRLKAARQDLKQFIQETGSKEDSARVSVHGFGRSAAGKATWAAKKADELAAEKQYRKNHNIGAYAIFEERMSMKNVRNIVKDMGIELKGAKISIVRDKDLIDKPNFMGYTFPDGSAIQLYPAAFTNREQLVKTIGHEYIHLKQTLERGRIESMEELLNRESEAYASETQWWENYCKKTGFGK